MLDVLHWLHELIWFDRQNSQDEDKSLKILNIDSSCSIPPSEVVRDLGVLLDCNLNMTQHISAIARAQTSETLPG